MNGIFNIAKDVLIVLDFIVSTIGGILKNSKPEVSNLLFIVGAILLFFAVCMVFITTFLGKKK